MLEFVIYYLGYSWHVQDYDQFHCTGVYKLCSLVCSLIVGNARSTNELQLLRGRPPKLSPEQRLLNFIWYIKCENIKTYDSYHYNWSASCVYDDAIFTTSCICEAIASEMR
jgi:hypothetical protein